MPIRRAEKLTANGRATPQVIERNTHGWLLNLVSQRSANTVALLTKRDITGRILAANTSGFAPIGSASASPVM